MRVLLRQLIVAVTLAFAAAGVQAVIIDFDDGTDNSAIGAFYSGLGVTFSNAEWDGFVSPDEGLVGAGGLKLVDIGPTYEPKVGNPIVATFSFAITSFSIRGLNVGANGARIDAYDAAVGGNLIDFDEAFGIGVGVDNHPLLVSSASPIWRIELYQPLDVTTEGLLFDNMAFEPAQTQLPEPVSLALLGLGLAGLAFARRRKPG